MSFHRNPKLKQFLIRYVSWPIEAIFLLLALVILRIIPIDIASSVTGWLASKIGPLTSWHKRAKSNLLLAMPELSKEKHSEILFGMWWNLGRNIGEFSHTLGLMNSPARVKIEGLEKIVECEKGSIIFGAHQANWEVIPTI
jgi:Lauroyl/myristoyl acyltransferase